MIVQEQLDVAQLWIGLVNNVDGLRWMDGSPVSFLNWDEELKFMDQYKNECVGKYSEFFLIRISGFFSIFFGILIPLLLFGDCL